MNDAFLVSCAMLLGCASAQPARLLSTADDFKTLGQTNTIGPYYQFTADYRQPLGGSFKTAGTASGETSRSSRLSPEAIINRPGE